MSPKSAARVLVIDDDVATLRFLAALFAADEEVSIIQCTDAEAAFAELNREKFDLVILDLWMPRVDGHAIVQWLREQPSSSRPQVIVMSAERPATLRRLPHDIVQIAFEKPFDIEELRDAVHWCLRRSKAPQTEDALTPVVESYSAADEQPFRAARFRSTLEQITSEPESLTGEQQERGTPQPRRRSTGGQPDSENLSRGK